MVEPEQRTVAQVMDGHITLMEAVFYLGLLAIGAAIGAYIIIKYSRK